MTSKLSSASSLLGQSKRDFDGSFEKKAQKASAIATGANASPYSQGMRRQIRNKARGRLREEVNKGVESIRSSKLSPAEKKQKAMELRQRAKDIAQEIDSSVKNNPAMKFSGGGRVRGMGAATRGGNFSRNG